MAKINVKEREDSIGVRRMGELQALGACGRRIDVSAIRMLPGSGAALALATARN
jgi:hypothetical protein